MSPKTNSSFASDLSRIVLLGIAFETSRYVAREILRGRMPVVARFDDGDDNDNDDDDDDARKEECQQQDEAHREGDGNAATAANDDAIIAQQPPLPLVAVAAVRIIEGWKVFRAEHRLKRYCFSKKVLRDKGHHLGLCLMCGACYYILDRSNKSRQQHHAHVVSSSLFGVYFSSVVTSFGLLLWICPDLFSHDDDADDADDDSNLSEERIKTKEQDENPDTTLSKDIQESSWTVGKETDSAADGPTKVSPAAPSAIFRPPLPPNDDEPPPHRRPRSDSLRSAISECSVDVVPTMQQTPVVVVVDKSKKKYLEILVHNVSHTDLILGLSGDEGGSNNFSAARRAISCPPPFPAEFEDTPRKNNASSPHDVGGATKKAATTAVGGGDDEKYIMCRPRFSAFDLFSRRVLGELRRRIEGGAPPREEESNSGNGDSTYSARTNSRHPLHRKIISYPRYERSGKTARYTLVTPRPSDQYMLPVGFDLERGAGGVVNDATVEPREMTNLRLRGRDVHRVDPSLLGEATPRRMNFLPPTTQQQQLQTMHSPPPDERQGGMQTPSRHDCIMQQERLRINAVFFPLLATLLPRWLGQIADKFGEEGGGGGAAKKLAAPLHSPNVKKVVLLVSGVGTPRNWTHSISGNSTQTCAELCEMFIHVLYPDVTVVRIHSSTNIFRYDENITFATQELMPCIDAYRDAHARSEPYPDEKQNDKLSSSSDCHPFDPDWRQSVSVAYSFADGSAARSHAIQSALRPYRPTYFHFWQLKTFWHESKITDEDIEVHSFEEMETVPAMAVDQTSDAVMMVAKEMKAFRKSFLETLKDGGRSDLKSFWLRKTKKPVLAVLLVQKPGGKHILFRGTNMEVSMPTGSLCAERNVIGTALANDPGLKREDLLMVAVLSVQLPEDPPKRLYLPPGPSLCQPVSSFFAKEVEDKLAQHQAQGGMRRTTSTSSFASIAEDGLQVNPPKPMESEDWEMDAFGRSSTGLSPLASPSLAGLAPEKDVIISPLKGKEAALIPDLNLSRLSPSSNVSGSSTPKRRITLYQKKTHGKIGGGVKKQKQPLLVQPLEDMNPLKPCGSCNEWLKKIAESNPHFKVLTFTDTKCNGVYVSPCQD